MYEPVTLACNVTRVVERNLNYSWYKNNRRIAQEKTLEIMAAKLKDSGNYQCRAGTSDKSDSVRLIVSKGKVILQVPPRINKGDTLLLRCHSRPKDNARNALFYKGNMSVQHLGADSVLRLEEVDGDATGSYRCSIMIGLQIYLSNEEFISVTEERLKPLISLSPQWGTILTDDFVILTCNAASAARGTRTYSWYKNGNWISGNQQSLEIENAEVTDRGDYQCQAGASQRSAPVTLDVRNDFVILQAPPSVYEGDSLTLNCYSLPGYNGRNTVFYRDNSTLETQPTDSYLRIGTVNWNTSGTYRCAKEVNYYDYFYHSYGFYTHSAEVIISVSELFTLPQITVSSDLVIEGDHMTITCDTELRPHRETTELQFAFYRNGHHVQGFSLSNQYGVPSAQLEDSGNYTCEVQTPTGSVRKRSNIVVIQIQRRHWVQLVPRLTWAFLGTTVMVVIVMAAVIVTLKFRHKIFSFPATINPSLPNTGSEISASVQPRQGATQTLQIIEVHAENPLGADPRLPPGEDIMYAYIDFSFARKVDRGNTTVNEKDSVIYSGVRRNEAQGAPNEETPDIEDFYLRA
ncbi:Fc receptor-like protein 6 [Xenopus tropicalis]|uniref:Fc receptor-like protein 6 n=1 Tax=Xenopus tropicalis TaxID=8364 RepID=A0A803JDN8_XENTR|nr:Fc receptor-like protein 6 [Xenopus tropicalis]